jgi:hypothetical protein
VIEDRGRRATVTPRKTNYGSTSTCEGWLLGDRDLIRPPAKPGRLSGVTIPAPSELLRREILETPARKEAQGIGAQAWFAGRVLTFDERAGLIWRANDCVSELTNGIR